MPASDPDECNEFEQFFVSMPRRGVCFQLSLRVHASGYEALMHHPGCLQPVCIEGSACDRATDWFRNMFAAIERNDALPERVARSGS